MPLSEILSQPLWFVNIHSTVTPTLALTSPLRPWRVCVDLAPQSYNAVKGRFMDKPPASQLISIFKTMFDSSAQVSIFYPRLIQVLVDVAVSFLFLNDSCAMGAHGEVYRFLEDNVVSCPPRLGVSFREASDAFGFTPPAGGTHDDHSLHFQRLIAHVVDAMIRELLPPYEASPEITFNSEARLRAGDTIMIFIDRVRRLAATHNVRDDKARMFIMTQIQNAGANPNMDKAVHSEVVKHVLPHANGVGSFGSFYNELRTHAGLGGYLNDPIIPSSPIPPPAHFYSPPAGAPPGAPTPAGPPVGPSAVTPPPPPVFFTPPGQPPPSRVPGTERRFKQWYDLSRIYPLLNLPVPEYTGSRDCPVCSQLLGFTLLKWSRDAPRPDGKNKEKFEHDPWRCNRVPDVCRARAEAGDARFTPYLCSGLPDRPFSLEDIPTPPSS